MGNIFTALLRKRGQAAQLHVFTTRFERDLFIFSHNGAASWCQPSTPCPDVVGHPRGEFARRAGEAHALGLGVN